MTVGNLKFIILSVFARLKRFILNLYRKFQTSFRILIRGNPFSLLGLISNELFGEDIYAYYLNQKADRSELILVNLPDFAMYLDPRDQGISKELLIWGERERVVTNKYKSILREYPNDGSTVIIDIGANKGYFAFVAANIVPNSKIYAIEPVDKNYKALSLGIKENNFDNIYEHQVAIGGRSGLKDIKISKHSNRHTLSDIKNDQSKLYTGNKQRVKVTTIDSFIKENVDNTTDVFVLRLDLEGYELEVIRGAERLLSSAKPILIFIEIHPHRVGTKPIFEMISKLQNEYEFELVLAASGDEKVAQSYDELYSYINRDDVTGAAEVLLQRR